MITYKFNNILIGEVWFDEELNDANNVDVIFYRQTPRPLNGGVSHCEDFSTLIIDLSKDENEIWNGVHKNDRYKIRRAEKEQIGHEMLDPSVIDAPVIEEFADFYDRFAAWKGLSKVRRNRLRAYAESNSLFISKLKTSDGTLLGCRTYLKVDSRVRLLQSASTRGSVSDSKFRSMVGRANRFHHWRDIVEFKNRGIEIYDFGGWYAGDSDAELLAVNQFKEKFGGDVVAAVNFSRPLTMKGSLYVMLRNAYMKLMDIRHSLSKFRQKRAPQPMQDSQKK